jgi:ADP-ribose pyrophosphatase
MPGENGVTRRSEAVVKANKVVYHGRIITVEVADVRLPHGAETRMEVVRHPGSVVLLPMPDADHLMLVKQYRYPAGRTMWELPAGSLKPGEPPEAGAARECEEETGLIPAVVQRLGTFYATPGYCDEQMTFYKMKGLQEPGPGHAIAPKDEDEDIEVGTFSIDEVRAMVNSGEIVDLKTAMALSLL